MEKDTFITLMSRKLSGEIANKELALLNLAIQTDESYRLLARQLERYYKGKGSPQTHVSELAHVWACIEQAENENQESKFNFSPPRFSFLRSTWWKVAAVLILLTGVGFLTYPLVEASLNGMETLVAKEEKIFKILDDGTNVWLNKQSTLRYTKDFGDKKREIFLQGEAYFDVVKRADIPLWVHAGGVDIEVKGTSFNVNAYEENQQVQIALVRGVITVSERDHPQNKVWLKPQNKVIFSQAQGLLSSRMDVMQINEQALFKETGWTTDTLIFQKEKLSDLVLKLEKKYDVKIDVQSEKLKEKRFSGTFTDETIQEVMEALKLSYPLTYSIRPRLVIIKDQE